MCKEDIREGRRKRTGVKTVIIGAGSNSELCGSLPARTNITFLCAATELCSVTPDGADLNEDAGVAVWQNTSIASFDIESHGDLVTRGWRGWNVGAANHRITVIETWWHDPDKPGGV